MAKSVNYSVEEGVALLGIDNPPVNALSASVRQGLEAALDAALSDPTVNAIVIMGEGKTFSVGADITEFGAPPQKPQLPELCNRFEDASKPVIAAVHGSALGGGFELALSAHYRLAHRKARFGLPEVKLGLLPGAGGTQRAPRLGGAEVSLDLMLSGRQMQVDASEAQVFFDEIFEGDLSEAAVRFATSIVASGAGPRLTRAQSMGFADPLAYQKTISARRNDLVAGREVAPLEILRCIEAAELLPFEQGLMFERAAFENCLESDQSKALRHMFFAERNAAKFPELKEGRAKDLERIGIVGGGGVGRGLALACLTAGYEVILTESNSARLDKALHRIEEFLDRAVRRGRLSPGLRDKQRTRLQGASDLVALSKADFVIETASEDMQSKRTIFAQLDGVAKEGAVLATHTDFLDVNLIGGETENPAEVLGLSFQLPVMSNRLVEVVCGPQSGADAIATAVMLTKKLGKIPVRSAVSDGLIGFRLMAACWTATDKMLVEGATPYIIDDAMEEYGMAKGPYKLLDSIGLDRLSAHIVRVANKEGDTEGESSIVDLLCEMSKRGVKDGHGFYDYDAGATAPEQDPTVISLIRAERERRGLAARRFESEEIQRRCLAAIVNEGARVLREKVALRASDIDAAMVHGFGFPRWRGGPMMAADLKGLLKVKHDLEEFTQHDGEFWQPEPIFEELIKSGLGFSSPSD